jgi:siderophore synthetase component
VTAENPPLDRVAGGSARTAGSPPPDGAGHGGTTRTLSRPPVPPGLPEDLVDGYRAALPAAVDTVGRRLLGAAWREQVGRARTALATWPSRRYGFDRWEGAEPVVRDPAELLRDVLGVDSPGLAAELSDAVTNLALAYARRDGIDAALRASGAGDLTGLASGRDADDQVVASERLSTEGHNLHPCGRTRLGWRVADLLAHDQESPATSVGFVAVRRDLHHGHDVGDLLRDGYPQLPEPPDGYVLQPVHSWQLSTVDPRWYGAGWLRRVDPVTLPAVPTTALRTVLLDPDRYGRRRYLKLSLDIQVTSTRRTISAASAHNGPAISALLADLLAGDPGVLLLPEVAGAWMAAPDGRTRELSTIVREGLTGRLHEGEVAVSAAALPARSAWRDGTVLDELLARFDGSPLAFLTGYAQLLLPPLLRLADAGVGLEAHLQNSIPTFVAGRPYRIAFRDFAGLRLHLPRLRARTGNRLDLLPGSVVGTEDLSVMRAKLGYTAVQAHLGELVVLLARGYGVTERDSWRAVRTVLDRSAVDPGDHAFLTAPTVPHKALVRMRLSGDGDIYVPVRNPLHDP